MCQNVTFSAQKYLLYAGRFVQIRFKMIFGPKTETEKPPLKLDKRSRTELLYKHEQPNATKQEVKVI